MERGKLERFAEHGGLLSLLGPQVVLIWLPGLGVATYALWLKESGVAAVIAWAATAVCNKWTVGKAIEALKSVSEKAKSLRPPSTPEFPQE